jgi:quercetin dioxygenase-like cupin family protein
LAHWACGCEFILVLEGNIQMGINTEQRLLEPGDIAICCSNSVHYFSSEDYNEMNQQKDYYPIIIKGMLLGLCG